MLVGAGLRRAALFVMFVGVVSVTAAVDAPDATATGFDCWSGGSTYVVGPGDSWYGIAARAAVDPSSLLEANDGSVDDVLVVGDRLCLPGGADVSGICTSYTVRTGDSWGSISVRVGSTPSAVAGANGVGTDHTIHPGEVVCLPSGASAPGVSSPGSAPSGTSGGSYIVVRNDSWSTIAQWAEVSMGSLLAANGAGANDLLLPGDVLRLPGGAKQPLPRAASVVLAGAPTQGPCGYGDTWGHARHGGRRHVGVDIFSGDGDYVYAVADGRLTARWWEGAGGRSGNAWMLTGVDGNQFFYAHLSGFPPQLRAGSRVQAGQIIGWVGSTGNSSAPHLHFEIRPGGGDPVDPYPIVHAQGACNEGRPYTQPGGWIPDRKR